MPFDKLSGLSIKGQGHSNRDVVLREISEAREELKMLSKALSNMEAIILAQPETGIVKIESKMVKALLDSSQAKPFWSWMLSLFESFYMIVYASMGSHPASAMADTFKRSIESVADNSISISIVPFKKK